jgi:hypothetical protein
MISVDFDPVRMVDPGAIGGELSHLVTV